ncbi:MAG: hypothetical protein NC409_11460 [Clostridium sp.]|nr:hypothetical protein [Clostridium sp.]
MGRIIPMFASTTVENTLGGQVATAVTDGLSSVATQLGSILVKVVPIALGIVGAVMVVTFGVRTFRRLTGK